jgi:hypothetical protein
VLQNTMVPLGPKSANPSVGLSIAPQSTKSS